jgi:hypothetical protein
MAEKVWIEHRNGKHQHKPEIADMLLQKHPDDFARCSPPAKIFQVPNRKGKTKDPEAPVKTQDGLGA